MDMDKTKLSIIIPVYNVEKYLEKCLNSIISQNLSRCEILLIDDGSPDNCGAICDLYAKKYDRIQSFHKENGGLSDARNYGIDKSNGEFIWFIDSDDYLEPNSIPKLLELIDNHNADVFVCQSKTVNELGETRDEKIYTINEKIYSNREYMEALNNNPRSVIFCAQYHIVKKKIITDNNLKFYKGILHEDELWTPQILLNASTIYYTGLNIYYHFMREGSIMHSKNWTKSGESDLIVSRELLKIYDNSNRDDLLYLRDHMVDTYLQSIWKISNFSQMNPWPRLAPLHNSYYLKTVLKSLLFTISPKLYLIIHKAKS